MNGKCRRERIRGNGGKDHSGGRNHRNDRNCKMFAGLGLAAALMTAAAVICGCGETKPDVGDDAYTAHKLQDETTAAEAQETLTIHLPARYDGREHGRTAQAEDQGNYGMCWAYASLLALENSLLPDRAFDFSEDHMVENPDFELGKEGGDFTMAMAYLLSWQGPVIEQPESAETEALREENSAVHVQEIRILPPDDRDAVKRAVMECGGVQSSMYITMREAGEMSGNYDPETFAYCYPEQREPNHDVVIVGWDDDFPKEAFPVPVSENGAFLCENSWGGQFGEDGFFYVSYCDGNLGKTNLCYPTPDPESPYRHIYQSDRCGWLGQIGYGTETAWAANAYAAEGREELMAVGFYATGEDTDYEVYVAEPEDLKSGISRSAKTGSFGNETAGFSGRRLAAAGHLAYSGYYTIPLRQSVPLEAGERFLVMIKLTTPGAVHPIAIEYDAGDGKCRVDLDDGEGYLSEDGAEWQRLEAEYGCNVCLKAYTG